MSHENACAPGIAAANSFARSSFKSTISTVAPDSANRRAVADPIPLAPPVIMAILPSMPNGSAIPLVLSPRGDEGKLQARFFSGLEFRLVLCNIEHVNNLLTFRVR